MSPTILWLKHGFLAYANPHLYVTHLECVDGQQWRFAPPHKLHPLPVSLVLWLNPSTDLVVADVLGNFYIYLAGVGLVSRSETPAYELTSYNHIEMIYQDLLVKLPLVGFRWLKIAKPLIINGAAVRDPALKQFSYLVKQVPPIGVTHPIPTKQACITVRRNGRITLYHQGEHKVEYHRVDCEPLPDLIDVSHALIGFLKDNRVMVSVVDSLTQQLFTYAVSIDWGHLTQLAARQKENPHYNTPDKDKTPPKLTVTKLAQMALAPTYVFDDELEQCREGHFANLQVLNCTATRDISLLVWYQYEHETRFLRYQLVPETELVLSLFTQLAERKGITATNPANAQRTLRLADELVRPGKLIRIDEMELLIVFVFEDRIDVFLLEMELINHKHSIPNDSLAMDIDRPVEPEVTKITLVFDVGYDFADIPASPMIVVSPTLLSHVAFYDNHPKLFPVVRKWGQQLSKEHVYTMAVAFAHSHAQACYMNCCCDDLIVLIAAEVQRLAAAKPQLAQDIVLLVLSESHKAINFALDTFSRESVDKLISNPPLQKLLSLQLLLGELVPLPVVSDIAWVVLNMRSSSFGIMFSLLSIYAQVTKKKPIDDLLADSVTRGERIISLIGSVKWFIDLMVYIYQELFQLLICRNQPNMDLKVTMENSLALPILLAKVPRLFLMYALSSIGKTREILKKLHKDLAEANKLYTPMKEALNRYFSLTLQLPISFSLFENYLRECDAYISKELATKLQGKDPGYALKLEQKLVCQGELLPEMQEIALVLLDRHQVNLNRDMKISELYFYDVDWLCVGVSLPHPPRRPLRLPITTDANEKQLPFQARLPYAVNEHIDALRKIVVSDGPKLRLRKCTRCRLVSLVTDPLVFDAPHTIGLWTMVFQRTCICGNLWVNIGN